MNYYKDWKRISIKMSVMICERIKKLDSLNWGRIWNIVEYNKIDKNGKIYNIYQ